MSVSSQATLCVARGAEVAQASHVSDGMPAMVRESVSRRTPEYRNDDSKPLTKHGLGGIARGVLSGSKTRMRVYLETV